MNYWRYAVAASVVLFLGVSSFLYFNNGSSLITEPAIVDVENFGTVGSDRAILTLEDGVNIALERGKGFAIDNIKSDGESIVYKNAKSKAIAYNYLTVPRSGQFFIELSDNTKVWLNSESQLKYPKEFVKGQDRKVELVYGEAYFEVSPSTKHQGAQFKVITNNQEIAVLGTEFNVKAYDDENTMYTTLVEGKVQVSNGVDVKEMHSGEQAIIAQNGNVNISIEHVNVYDQIAWKDGVFSFESVTLKEIAKVISRWYDVDIEFENSETEDVRFNGVFNKFQSLNKILENIQNTNYISAYEINDKKIILKK